MELERESMMRGGDVRCDICDKWIKGPCFFNDDHMMCRECDKIWEKQDERGLTEKLPLSRLLGTFLISTGVSLAVNDWPLVEFVSVTVSWGSGFLLGGKLYDYLKGRLA